MRLKPIFAFLTVALFSGVVHALEPGKIPDVYGKTYGDKAYVRFGAHEDAICGYDTTQTNDALVCGLSTASESILFMQKGDVGTNAALADAGTPTIYIMNSDPTKWVSISHDGTNAVIDTNTGIATFPDGLDLGAGSLSFGTSAVFEGATADAFETTLTVTDPTSSDKTITLPNQTGTVILSVGGVADAASAISGGTGTFVFEGTTADAFETTFAVTDPTADQTWTVPNFAVNAAFLGSTLTTNNIDVANSVWGASNSVVLEGATADAFETTITPTDPTADNTITLPNSTGTVHTSGAFNAFSTQSPTASTGATDTLLPSANLVKLQCNRSAAADTAITLDETGAVAGRYFKAYVDGNAANAGTCSFSDSSGVQQASGRTLDDWDTIEFLYTGTEWVESGGVNN